ncbi:MAG: aldehyde dehydrogenase [Flavobacteriales bacterium]|nr:aldehyde dehydrogenase [Flavobacteriales bacterium]
MVTKEVNETNGIAVETPISDSNMKKIVQKQRDYFRTGETKDVLFRIRALRTLKKAITAHESNLVAALKADLNKPELEAFATEIGVLIAEIDYNISRVRAWSRPERAPTALFFMPGKSRIYKEPFGTTLVIAPWNFPIKNLFGPVLGAMSAGNTCVMKPSELSPHTSAAMKEMIDEYFDPEYLVIVEGGVPETTELLKERFDYMLYTGGTEVGRIIYQAAARHLTPVTLELGGKSPTIVDDDFNIDIVAKRIAWGKCLNAGQVCIAPDYVLVRKGVKDKLIEALKKALDGFYDGDASKGDDFGRIITDKHFERVSNLIEGDIVYGGQTDAKTRYIAPTIIDNVKMTDKVMEEEIFGPVLPIVEYEELDEVIEIINSREKPLALYLFAKSWRVRNRILRNTSSGGVCINETVMNAGSVGLPFGGVGNSGLGAYNGKTGFDTFTHRKGVMTKAFAFDVQQKYPPYTASKLRFIKFAVRRLLG